MMSTVLIIDTIQPQYQLYIYKGKDLLASICGDNKAKTSQDITQKIKDLLLIANLDRQSLNSVGVITCPVSVTGAQIGRATAEAISLALKIPFLEVNLLETIKSSIPTEHLGNSLLLIKISDKNYAWARISEKKLQTDWEQGNLAILTEHLKKQTDIINIYVSNQVSATIFLNDDFKSFKILQYASDNATTRIHNNWLVLSNQYLKQLETD